MMKYVIRTDFFLCCLLFLNVNSIQIPSNITQYPTNPIWTGYLADPFVFEVNGTYYIIGTGRKSIEQHTFPALTSNDLIKWTYVGEILQITKQVNQPSTYWAPEIAENDGIFYLFYSVGFGDSKHRLRVVSSNSPLGPYKDSQSIELTNVTRLSFAIDPHPFYDTASQQWYLFYSRDFLDTNNGYRVGTGIVVDRLIHNMTKLAGNETIVLRAKHDWQLYQRNRFIYNQTYDWYTLQGSFIWQHDSGVYICFYTGGNWQNQSYGIDYAISYSSPMGPYIENTSNQVRITHSIEGIVIGPGHNSIIASHDKQTTYIVYHAWNEPKTIRSPYISQLNWKTILSNKPYSGHDFLLVTLTFLVYIVVILLIFHHAL